jgi:hypothetical protein
MLKNEEALRHFLGGGKHGSAFGVSHRVNLGCSLFLLEAWDTAQTHQCQAKERKRCAHPFPLFHSQPPGEQYVPNMAFCHRPKTTEPIGHRLKPSKLSPKINHLTL